MRTKPHIKIILHLIIITILIIGFLSFLSVNETGFLIITGLLFLSIFINRTSVLCLTSNELIIKKNNLLVIPFYQKRINLNDIQKVVFIDHGIIVPGESTNFAINGVIVLEILTGVFFYTPRFSLAISIKDKKDFEIHINISKKEVERFKKQLTKKLEKENK